MKIKQINPNIIVIGNKTFDYSKMQFATSEIISLLNKATSDQRVKEIEAQTMAQHSTNKRIALEAFTRKVALLPLEPSIVDDEVDIVKLNKKIQLTKNKHMTLEVKVPKSEVKTFIEQNEEFYEPVS